MLQFIFAVVLSFTCQPSIRNGWLCCSVPRAQAQTTFNCQGNTFFPVVVNQQNVLCSTPGTQGTCPSGAFCLASREQPNTFICCSISGGGGSLQCPNNQTPQQNSNGIVDCTTNQLLCIPNQFQCTASVNQPTTRICCPINSGGLPVCPNNGRPFLSNGNTVINCLPSQNVCPQGFSCQQAVSPIGTLLCCSSTPTATCPAGFTPSRDNQGNMINCAFGSTVGCPAGASCVSDSISQQSICCSPLLNNNICPVGQVTLLDGLNQPQRCSNIGSSCPAVGYSCVFSSVLNGFVCCGIQNNNNNPPVCSDGRNTFVDTTGQPVQCGTMTNPQCPFNYDCAQSTTIGVLVCCLNGGTSTTPTPPIGQQCPAGWNPYRNRLNQQLQYCSATTDSTCPRGYSCTPSSQASVYICCQYAESYICPLGTTFIENSRPRLCNRNMPNQCPRSYTCQQSTTPTVTICCSSQDDTINTLCQDRSVPAMIGANPRFCSVLNSNIGCPPGYICQLSTQQTNVCCLSSFSRLRQSPSSLLSRCPNGVTPSSFHRSCSSTANCPQDSTCIQSNIAPDISICCANPVPPDTRCKARRTLLVNQNPLECLVGSTCPSDYECSLETTNSRAVCCETPEKAQELCPDNRATFLIARNEEPMFCDGTAYICPNGQECVQSRNGSRHVCCSKIAECPTGTITPYESPWPIRCFSNQQCPHEQSCVSSTINDVRVCCSPFYGKSGSHDSPDDWSIIEG